MPDLVFLSYNHQDRAAVNRIRSALGQSVPVFIDEANLAKGLPWGPALAKALESATGVVVFFGPGGVGGWQEREIYFAINRQVESKQAGKEFPVIPVLLPQANPGAVPGFLKQNTWIDWPEDGGEDAGISALVSALGGGSITVSPRALEICPYRGLGTFRPEDSGFFFGRTDLVNALRAKVRERKVTAVVGPSGSGKSSVVMSGLLPQLRGSRPPEASWDIAVFTPGGYPWRSLADALAVSLPADLDASSIAADLASGAGALESTVKRVLSRPGAADRLLIVVDQMEELFTLSWTDQANSADRLMRTQRFIRDLLEVASLNAVHLVFTLRADFYGQAIQTSRELSDQWSNDGQVNVGPLTSKELTEVIAGPAAMVGLSFDAGLIETIKADVAAQPGSLPLLEYALTNLWQDARQHNMNRVTLEAYRRVGSVAGSIAKRAEDLYHGLPADRQKLARTLMLRVVQAARGGDEGSDTRRRASRAEVGEDAWSVAQVFARPENRLLVISGVPSEGTAESVVEVAHEALIANWSRLQDWLTESRTFLVWRQRLANYVEPWRDRPSNDLLLPGNLLKGARDQYKLHYNDLSGEERKYLKASFRRSARGKLFTSVGVAAALLALTATVGFWVYSQTIDYQIRQVTWEAPAAFEQFAQPQLQNEYLFALGLAGQTVFPSPSVYFQNRTNWLQRTVAVWSERLGLQSTMRPVTPLIEGLAAAGYSENVDRVIDRSLESGHPRLYALAALEAHASGRPAHAERYLVKGLDINRGTPDLSALVTLTYAAKELGDVRYEELLGQLDAAVRQIRPGELPYEVRAVLPYSIGIGRLDALLAAVPPKESPFERSHAFTEALIRGLIVNEQSELYNSLKPVVGYERALAGVALVRREAAMRHPLEIKQLADQLPGYEGNQVLVVALRELVKKRNVESAIETAQILKIRNALGQADGFKGLLQLLEKTERYDQARDLLQQGVSPYEFSKDIVALTADLLNKQQHEPARAFAERFDTVLDANRILAAAWMYLDKPEKAPAWDPNKTTAFTDVPANTALLLKMDTDRIRDLTFATKLLPGAGSDRIRIGTEVTKALVHYNQVEDAKKIAALTWQGTSPEDALVGAFSTYTLGNARGALETPADEIIEMCQNLERAGQKQASDAALASAFQNAVRNLSDGGRQAAWLAYANARLGRFSEARQLANLCPNPKYKLFADTAILGEYAVRRKPAVRKVLSDRGFPGVLDSLQ